MKRSRITIIAALMAFVMVLAACGGDDDAGSGDETDTTAATTEATEETTTTEAMAEETTTTEAMAEETTTTAGEALAITIWADDKRAPVVEAVAPAFTDATGVEVEVQIVDFGEIRSQVQTAGPAGEGPDLFVGASDWSGELAANGVTAPIDLGDRTDEFAPVAVDMFSFEGTLYAMPYATEAIALYYNADLVDTPPATWDDVLAICEGLPDITNCVGLPGGGDGGDAYHHEPFLTVFGGGIFPYESATGYDGTTVTLDSDETVAGVTFLQDQVEAGVIASTNYDTAKEEFTAGTQPFLVTGPWELGGFRDAGLNIGVVPLPTIDGDVPAPFVGGQGFYLSSFSENAVIAQSFLFDFIATPETMMALFEADPRPPAFLPTLEAVASDAELAAFAASADTGTPLPNIPEMGAVWGPLGDNLLAVRNGDLTALEAMEIAQQSVVDAIAGG